MNEIFPKVMKSRGVVTVNAPGRNWFCSKVVDEIEKRLDISLLKPLFLNCLYRPQRLFQGSAATYRNSVYDIRKCMKQSIINKNNTAFCPHFMRGKDLRVGSPLLGRLFWSG
jgi:hypothetical protein